MIEGRRVVAQSERRDQKGVEEEATAKDYGETFKGEATILYYDGGCGYTFVYNSQNSSNYTLKMVFLLYVNKTCIFLKKRKQPKA